MRYIVAIAAVVALAAGSGRTTLRAAADAAGDVKAVDALVYSAIAARDAGRLADLLDDGFTLTNTFADVYDKAKFLAACCTGPATSKTLLLGAVNPDVRVYGNAAVVTARTEMKFNRDGKDDQIAWRSLRVYAKSGTKWKLVAEQRTSF